MLSRVKTQGISVLIPEKTQRLEAATAVHCISQLFFLTPNDSNPACDWRMRVMHGDRTHSSKSESTRREDHATGNDEWVKRVGIGAAQMRLLAELEATGGAQSCVCVPAMCGGCQGIVVWQRASAPARRVAAPEGL